MESVRMNALSPSSRAARTPEPSGGFPGGITLFTPRLQSPASPAGDEAGDQGSYEVGADAWSEG